MWGDDTHYLRAELEEQRRENARLVREKAEREEQRQAELNERIAERKRSANSWLQAFEKQRSLLLGEANTYFGSKPLYPRDPKDPMFQEKYWWEHSLDQIGEAERIWKEEEAAAQDRIAELERRIEAEKKALRERVADRLAAAEEGKVEWDSDLPGRIRNNEIARWLDW